MKSGALPLGPGRPSPQCHPECNAFYTLKVKASPPHYTLQVQVPWYITLWGMEYLQQSPFSPLTGCYMSPDLSFCSVIGCCISYPHHWLAIQLLVTVSTTYCVAHCELFVKYYFIFLFTRVLCVIYNWLVSNIWRLFLTKWSLRMKIILWWMRVRLWKMVIRWREVAMRLLEVGFTK